MILTKTKVSKPFFYDLIKRLELLISRNRTRKQLLTLDQHLLKDVGLTQQQALLEAKRYFWQGSAQSTNTFKHQR